MFNNKMVAVLLVLVVSLGLFSCAQKKESAGPQRQGTLPQAPDFVLKDLDGNSFSLSSTRGKVVILDFFATWCPPCQAEIPHFQAMYEAYKDKGLVIVGISLDQAGSRIVKSFASQYGVTYPMVMGDQEVIAKYGGIRAIPTTFILDRKGRIVGKAVGYKPKEFFIEEIKKLL